MKRQGYNRRCYLKNKDQITARFYVRRKARIAAVRAAKDKPCADCECKYSYWVMQFDHVRGKKSFNIGEALSSIGLKRLLEEIEKCDIVCANCHADRTYKRQMGKWSSDEDAGPSSQATRV